MPKTLDHWPRKNLALAAADFCDANEVMESAFVRVMGRASDLSDTGDADLNRMNDAWDLARALGMIEGD